ncbi:MAG TPA: NepR family anti-sigma factor [Devosiaceae bacterium]|nr:NepR family anti-sigma factor [Devosiaceae bacterium]
MKDKSQMQHAAGARRRMSDDGLGPNSDIGMKLRALYGAVQDETIPDKFLELLEKLDQVELESNAQATQD